MPTPLSYMDKPRVATVSIMDVFSMVLRFHVRFTEFHRAPVSLDWICTIN